MTTEDLPYSAHARRQRSPTNSSSCSSPRRPKTLPRALGPSRSGSLSRSPVRRGARLSPKRVSSSPLRRLSYSPSKRTPRSKSPQMRAPRSPPPRKRQSRRDDYSYSASYSGSDNESDDSRSRSPLRRGRMSRRRRSNRSYDDSSSYDSYTSDSSRSKSRSRSPSRSRSWRRGKEDRHWERSESPRRRYGRDDRDRRDPRDGRGVSARRDGWYRRDGRRDREGRDVSTGRDARNSRNSFRGSFGSPQRYRDPVREVTPIQKRRRRGGRKIRKARERRVEMSRGKRPRVEDDKTRDMRTVFIWQLAQRVRESDVFEFFSKIGKVRDVRLIMDRMSSRHKSAGYVEFHEEVSVPKAVAMDGQPICGFPIAVKPSVEHTAAMASGIGGRGLSGQPVAQAQGGESGGVLNEAVVGWSMASRRPIRKPDEAAERLGVPIGNASGVPMEGPKLVSIEELKKLLNPLGLPPPKIPKFDSGIGNRGAVAGLQPVPLPTPETVARGRVVPVAGSPSGFTRLYVGSISFELSEGDLKALFEPFGAISSLQLQRDATSGRSRGYGFVEYVTHESAKKALEINGLVVAGRTMKVALASQENRGGSVMGGSGTRSGMVPLPGPAGIRNGGHDVTGELDEGKDGGLSMNANQRVMLMQQLSRGETVGGGQGVMMTEVKEATRSLMMKNMFNPVTEAAGFELELAEDVRDECASSYGKVRHLHVVKESQGVVFVRFESLDGGIKAMKELNGRWFGGMRIRAAFVDDKEYEKKFPELRGGNG